MDMPWHESRTRDRRHIGDLATSANYHVWRTHKHVVFCSAQFQKILASWDDLGIWHQGCFILVGLIHATTPHGEYVVTHFAKYLRNSCIKLTYAQMEAVSGVLRIALSFSRCVARTQYEKKTIPLMYTCQSCCGPAIKSQNDSLSHLFAIWPDRGQICPRKVAFFKCANVSVLSIRLSRAGPGPDGPNGHECGFRLLGELRCHYLSAHDR